jgi:hypothetical protein
MLKFLSETNQKRRTITLKGGAQIAIVPLWPKEKAEQYEPIYK